MRNQVQLLRGSNSCHTSNQILSRWQNAGASQRSSSLNSRDAKKRNNQTKQTQKQENKRKKFQARPSLYITAYRVTTKKCEQTMSSCFFATGLHATCSIPSCKGVRINKTTYFPPQQPDNNEAKMWQSTVLLDLCS